MIIERSLLRFDTPSNLDPHHGIDLDIQSIEPLPEPLETAWQTSLAYERRGARLNDNAPGRTRTCDLRFRKPPPGNVNTLSASTCELASENYSAYPSSQVQNEGADVRLQQIIDSWPSLPEAVRAGIVVMVEVASNS